ncbi:MAG: arylsulfatase A-like enzyme [Pirellulaceae bacterium]|jgi:arylsulfatase A-like enzyme
MFQFLAMTRVGCRQSFPRHLVRRITTLTISLVAAFFAQAVHLQPVNAKSSERPNIVLIMTDDMGYGDLGFHGNPLIDTPNIDAMAKRSSLIKQFYVSPVCAPTRACLMTGRYNYRTRAIDTWIGRAMMDTQEVTVAEVLSGAGYRTGIFGKWHLGDCYPMRPMDQGFAESLVHRGGGIGQPSDPAGAEGKYTDPILFRNGEAEQAKGYCTDVYYSAAMKFIEETNKSDKPFFVYLPDNCPHGPFHDVPPNDYQNYKKLNLNNDQFPQNQGHPLPRKTNVDQRARIFAMITNVDRNIGRLLKRLDALQLTENTIVIFMVDNGPNGRRYVDGMKGNKTMVHEGGVRSPFFIQWPAGLKKRVEASGPYAHIDVMPTLLEASGAEKPQDLKLDGVSFLSALKGEALEAVDRSIVIQSHRGDRPVKFHNFMIRNGDWKLLHGSGFGLDTFKGAPKFELFNLKSDPLELKNVVAENPAVLKRLKAEYEEWFADVGSTRPDNYSPPRIHIGTPHENPTTLTRQDWRHLSGRPWARDSLGFWLLKVTKEGKYDVECRFAAHASPEVLTLIAGGDKQTQQVAANSNTANFKNISLADGDLRLQFELNDGKRIRGIHQADVSLQ